MTKQQLKQIIKQQIRMIILQQDNIKSIDDIKTIGDLKQFLSYIGKYLQTKNKNQLLKMGGGAVAKIALSIIPFGGIANVASQIAQSVDDLSVLSKVLFKLNAPDNAKKYKFKTDSILQKFLHIDASLSNILEDTIQQSFLQHLEKYLSSLDDNDDIPDLSQLLRQYINDGFLSKGKQSKLQKFNQGKIIKQQTPKQNKQDKQTQKQFDQIVIQKSNYFIIYKPRLKRYKGNSTKLMQFNKYLLNRLLDSPSLDIDNTTQKNVKQKLKSTLNTKLEND